MAQMESEEVERVRDLRIGERPRRMEEMRRADFMVARRSWVRLGCGIGGRVSGIVVVAVPLLVVLLVLFRGVGIELGRVVVVDESAR